MAKGRYPTLHVSGGSLMSLGLILLVLGWRSAKWSIAALGLRRCRCFAQAMSRSPGGCHFVAAAPELCGGCRAPQQAKVLSLDVP